MVWRGACICEVGDGGGSNGGNLGDDGTPRLESGPTDRQANNPQRGGWLAGCCRELVC